MTKTPLARGFVIYKLCIRIGARLAAFMACAKQPRVKTLLFYPSAGHFPRIPSPWKARRGGLNTFHGR